RETKYDHLCSVSKRYDSGYQRREFELRGRRDTFNWTYFYKSLGEQHLDMDFQHFPEGLGVYYFWRNAYARTTSIWVHGTDCRSGLRRQIVEDVFLHAGLPVEVGAWT